MKSVMITGANEGIGYHMVRQFLEDGKNITVIDINTEQLEPLITHYPGRLFAEKGDVRNAGFVFDAARRALDRFGAIDYAIHNACYCPFGDFEMLRDEEYFNTFAVNYYGAINLCRAVLPIMRKQKSGKVFFTSSAIGITGFSNISPYASSKGALETLAKCLGLEYQDSGVSFHILHPPLTKTRSAEPLPVPENMKLDAGVVGRGLAKRVDRNRFVICHSNVLLLQTRIMYLFPVKMGKFLNKGVKKLMIKNSEK
jgi:NAD(P)-dependent dehydrogenase (short-subunit alcohol dehydrogenase family)